MSGPRIILVTDPRYPIERVVRTIDALVAALPPGSWLVQHRDKSSSSLERDRAAARIRETGARFVVNGTADDAARLGAAGVHLPGDRPDIARARAAIGQDAWISVAAHDDAAVERAATMGATAALVSPIYATAGKGDPRGEEALVRARAIASGRVLVYALGGVDARRAASCARAGADGIAAIRAILDAPAPAEVAAAMLEAFEAPAP